MEHATAYVREPVDPEEVERYQDLFRDRGGFTGPPVVVHSDPGTQKRWIVSDPHRHAAAVRAGVEVPTVELRELWAAAGGDYDSALERARQAPEVTSEEVFVGSRPWFAAVVGALPEEVKHRYWTETRMVEWH